MEDLRRSYLSAGEMPWKLLRSQFAVREGRVRPLHFSLNPTNRCNGSCNWCCCRDVDRTRVMDGVEAVAIIKHFAYSLEADAVTITGGGEPTLHDGLGLIVKAARECKLQLGLVTNGLRWAEEVAPSWARDFEWIRVSVIDRDYDAYQIVMSICMFARQTPIGVTFTVTERPDVRTAAQLCRLANAMENFTHIRFVQNILQPSREGMLKIHNAVAGITEKALFQYRNNFEQGTNPCLVSRLKPYIDADGSVYPCCSVQYATEETRCLPESMRMCHWSKYENAPPFDGSVCKRCFYGEYNRILAGLLAPIQHPKFV